MNREALHKKDETIQILRDANNELVEKLENMQSTFNLLGGYEDIRRLWAENKELRQANRVMLDIKTEALRVEAIALNERNKMKARLDAAKEALK